MQTQEHNVDVDRTELYGFLSTKEIQDLIDELLEPPRRMYEMGGWPRGEQETEADWNMVISHRAYTKLMAWNGARRGMELTGYAILTDRPPSRTDLPHTYWIDDIILLTAIEETSGGYTEMSPEDRVKGMIWAKEKGRSTNQLVWWHIHPITGWSGIDTNTMRQRVHEIGTTDQVQTLSFVLTPIGIRCRWDQANPHRFVDEIPVTVSDQADSQDVIEALQKEMAAEVDELFKRLADERGTFPVWDMDEEVDYWWRDGPYEEPPEIDMGDLYDIGEEEAALGDEWDWHESSWWYL